MTAPKLSPEFRSALKAAMAHEFRGDRQQAWARTEPRTEAEAERLLALHPDPVDPGIEAAGEWEDELSERVDTFDPDDLDVPHPGGARWERNVMGEAWT